MVGIQPSLPDCVRCSKVALKQVEQYFLLARALVQGGLARAHTLSDGPVHLRCDHIVAELDRYRAGATGERVLHRRALARPLWTHDEQHLSGRGGEVLLHLALGGHAENVNALDRWRRHRRHRQALREGAQILRVVDFRLASVEDSLPVALDAWRRHLNVTRIERGADGDAIGELIVVGGFRHRRERGRDGQ
ncbi:hypothetical protein T492DRAFT_385075 [Pavlovales sp. CCMP2436]|nr:hypothetical protein T492DRAFT_385075 [Pavlovales sp. CCMP2436]